MKVYVFGDKDVPGDEGAIEAAEGLGGAVDGVSFVFVDPNEDVPFVDEERVVILDVRATSTPTPRATTSTRNGTV